jgi:hypothetical protein
MAYTFLTTTFPEEVYSVRTPLTAILDTPWSALSPECRELLTKILGAVNHSPESVRLVHQDSLDMSSWVEPPARLVAFVTAPKGITQNEKITTPTTEMVVTEPLSTLLGNEAVKRKFWTAFKTLFPS